MVSSESTRTGSSGEKALKAVLRIAVLCSVATLGFASAPGLRSYAPPKAAPTFTVTTLDGIQRTNAGYLGKVLLVHFWATWCIPCIDEMPTLQQMAQEFSNQGTAVLAIAVNDDPKAVQSFVDRTGVSFPIAIDPSGDAMTAWAAMGVPTTLILDRGGEIRNRITGPADWGGNAMSELLTTLVRE